MDIARPRTVSFHRKCKSSTKAPEVFPDAPQDSRLRRSGSILRNMFTGHKRPVSSVVERSVLLLTWSQGTKPSNSIVYGVTPNPNFNAIPGSAQPPVLPWQGLQASQAGPENSPAIPTPRKLVKRPNVSQVVITTTTPPRSELQRKPSRLNARLWKRESIDILEELKSDIQATAQKIESKTWCISVEQPTSSLSLRDMLVADISPETRELLRGGLKEFQEYTKKQEEQLKREEDERKEQRKVEDTLEVVESKIVKDGLVYHRFERLAPPCLSGTTLRTLDPRAQASLTAGISIFGECAASPNKSEDRPRSTESGLVDSGDSIMERSRGIPRRDLSVLGRKHHSRIVSISGSEISRRSSYLERAKRRDSKQPSVRQSIDSHW